MRCCYGFQLGTVPGGHDDGWLRVCRLDTVWRQQQGDEIIGCLTPDLVLVVKDRQFGVPTGVADVRPYGRSKRDNLHEQTVAIVAVWELGSCVHAARGGEHGGVRCCEYSSDFEKLSQCTGEMD